MTFSGEGVSQHQKKVVAFQKASSHPPKNANEIRNLLVLATYVSKFIKDNATITELLWKQTKNEPEKQEKIHTTLKKAITTDTMSYFNPKWQTEIIAEASTVGLGSIFANVNP